MAREFNQLWITVSSPYFKPSSYQLPTGMKWERINDRPVVWQIVPYSGSDMSIPPATHASYVSDALEDKEDNF